MYISHYISIPLILCFPKSIQCVPVEDPIEVADDEFAFELEFDGDIFEFESLDALYEHLAAEQEKEEQQQSQEPEKQKNTNHDNTCNVDQETFDGITEFVFNGRSYPKAPGFDTQFAGEKDDKFPWFSGNFGCSLFTPPDSESAEPVTMTVIEKHGEMEENVFCVGIDSMIIHNDIAFLCVDEWMDSLCPRAKVRVSTECLLSQFTADCHVNDEWLCSFCDCSEDFYHPIWAKNDFENERYGKLQYDAMEYFVDTRYVESFDIYGNAVEIEQLEYQEMETMSAKRTMELVPQSNTKKKIKLFVCLFC